MKHTFFLKKPQRDKKKNIVSNNETLILFSCYFKSEAKQFIYSTGENIKPLEWDYKENRCISKGLNKSDQSSTIQGQLNRYTKVFEATEAMCIKTDEDFTSKILRDAFEKEFKKVSNTKDLFFEAYDIFMTEKQKRKEWSFSTVKRYNNIKNHLKNFELDRKYKLTFGKINETFYTEFLDYCYEDLNHYSNTVSRNIGLMKTFLNWALKEGYTYNDAHNDFIKPKTVITEEVALTLEQVEDIFNLELKTKSHQQVRDVFVFQCLVGMRYGELKTINKNVVSENSIMLKEEKDSEKPYREIPLFEISKYILRKYNYKLPLISEQKQNKYIKDILEAAEYKQPTEYAKSKGKAVDKFVEPFYKRIGTHTARRTFITIMKGKGIADKTIMKITGHTDPKTLNVYYKVSGTEQHDAVEKAFGTMQLPKLKVV